MKLGFESAHTSSKEAVPSDLRRPVLPNVSAGGKADSVALKDAPFIAVNAGRSQQHGESVAIQTINSQTQTASYLKAKTSGSEGFEQPEDGLTQRF